MVTFFFAPSGRPQTKLFEHLLEQNNNADLLIGLGETLNHFAFLCIFQISILKQNNPIKHRDACRIEGAYPPSPAGGATFGGILVS